MTRKQFRAAYREFRKVRQERQIETMVFPGFVIQDTAFGRRVSRSSNPAFGAGLWVAFICSAYKFKDLRGNNVRTSRGYPRFPLPR